MEDLLKTALSGTGKAPSLSLDAIDAADALALSVEGTPEQSLLLRAGAAAAYRLAGYVPASVGALEPAPSDDAPPASPRIAETLRSMCSGSARECMPELLDRMARAGLRIPHQSLPLVLAVGDAETREAIRPVLGPRGEWLARLNPDWAWAAPERNVSEDGHIEALRARWDEGGLETRVAALRRLRELHPADAIEWLKEALPAEKAERRAKLIEPLATGLSREDEPFLESLLDDRSDVVRGTAAALLMHIPESALRARMVARAGAMLDAERGGWPRRKLKLICNPPEEIDKAWARDGVVAKPPHGVGKRAWWTTQVLSVVDLGHWEQRFEAGPEELIAAAGATDYAEDILKGWLHSARMYVSSSMLSGERAQAWAPALWQAGSTGKMQKLQRDEYSVYSQALALLKALPVAEAEKLALEFLEKDRWRNAKLFLDVAPALRSPWSATFCRAYLKHMRRTMNDVDLAWVMTLPLAQTAIPCECLGEALKFAEEAHAQFEGYMRNRTGEFLNVVRVRHEFVQEIPIQE